MTTTRPPVRPFPVPGGPVAHRLEWPFLPPHVRDLVEGHCGSPVEEAESADAGFTAGFASVLTCADGSRHFVKAASVQAQGAFAQSYREEARKLATLPESVPAPRLLWSHDDDWVVLGIEYVGGAPPPRPWRQHDLDACLDTLELVAQALTPPPQAMAPGTFAAEFAALPSYWTKLRTTLPNLAHRDEVADLAARFADVTAGDTVVHTDLRDDNVILDPAGKVWFCDWNWPVRGAAWIDTVILLIGARGDGLDVESILSTRPLTRDVPAEDVDVLLALLTGFFLHHRDLPSPTASPYLRDFQSWQGEVCWDWLLERRGWDR